jgi:hypothetical protein
MVRNGWVMCREEAGHSRMGLDFVPSTKESVLRGRFFADVGGPKSRKLVFGVAVDRRGLAWIEKLNLEF